MATHPALTAVAVDPPGPRRTTLTALATHTTGHADITLPAAATLAAGPADTRATRDAVVGEESCAARRATNTGSTTGTADATLTGHDRAHTATAGTAAAADPALATHTAISGGPQKRVAAAPGPTRTTNSTRKTATPGPARHHRPGTRSAGPTLAAGPAGPSTPKQQGTLRSTRPAGPAVTR